MHFAAQLKNAARGAMRVPVRTCLALLGIVIGVASVVAIIAIGRGATTDVERVIAGIDSNHIVLVAIAPRREWLGGIPRSLSVREGLSVEDLRAFKRDPRLGAQTIGVRVSATSAVTVQANGRRADAILDGTDISGLRLLHRSVIQGAAFSSADLQNSAPVALISQFAAQQLFGSESATGRRVQIASATFLVIGELKDANPPGVQIGSAGGDTSVIVPYTTLLRRVSGEAPLSILVKSETPSALPSVERYMSDLMESRRGRRNADFITTNVAAAVAAYAEGSSTMARLLAAVAAVSLVVGGIGIANIMLANVVERRHEIGVYLALGARARDVKKQFLVEAMVLGGIGGLAGAVLGSAVALLLHQINGWTVVLDAGPMAGAMLCGVTTASAAGWYPAHRASSLNPIDALKAL